MLTGNEFWPARQNAPVRPRRKDAKAVGRVRQTARRRQLCLMSLLGWEHIDLAGTTPSAK